MGKSHTVAFCVLECMYAFYTIATELLLTSLYTSYHTDWRGGNILDQFSSETSLFH